MTEIPAGSINASLVLTPAVIAALRSQGWLAPDENEPAKIGLAVAQLLTAPLRSNRDPLRV